MKRVLILQLFFTVISGIQGQPGSAGLEKQIEELRVRIKSLEKENELLKNQSRANDSLAYCQIRSEIFEALANVSQLDFDFQNTTDKIAVTGLFTKLMKANNPTSEILGFQFTEVIFSASEKHFREILKDGRDKKRFSQVITKIIDNPVVSSLANTNPITSVVAALISTVAGFTTSRVDLDKEGSRIRNVSVDQVEVFDNECISAFRSDLQVYIDFYDALIIASNAYLEGLEELHRKYSYLIQSVQDYKAELSEILDIKQDNILISLSRLLPDPSNDDINFRNNIIDEKIHTARQLAVKYPVLQQAVSDFKEEYNALLYNFLSDYMNTLETALDFPDENIDKSRTKELIRDIESFISSQKITEKEEIDAFR
jgi:hypothetical protein